MTEFVDLEHIEEVPTIIPEGLRATFNKKVKRELRILVDGLKYGFKDSALLLSRMFVPRSVDRSIKEGAEWFEVIPKKPTTKAVLLCHGFAQTPEVYKEFAPLLAAKGYYVRAIRVAGHGTSVGDLARKTATDWFASVVWHYEETAKTYQDISYVGHSLGGTLGMLLSTIRPVTKIVAMCSPVKLDIRPAKFVRQASILVKYWPKAGDNREQHQKEDMSSYTAVPLYAIAGIFDACDVLRSRTVKFTSPMLYISAGLDHETMQNQPDKVRN